MPNKDVAAKYGVLKNTLSAWVKNKHKLTTSLEKKGIFSSRKSTRCGSYDQRDKAVFHWFIRERSQKVPIDWIILQKNPQNLRKHWGLRNLKHQIVGSISGRKGINIITAFYLPLLYYVEYFYKEFLPFFLGLRSSTCKELAFSPSRQN